MLFVTNNKVKKNCSKLILSEEDYEIADIFINAFDNIAEDGFCYRNSSSQIFKFNSKDLIVIDIWISSKQKILSQNFALLFQSPNRSNNFFDLIRLTKLFYNFKVIDDLIAKTMIELRPNIPGFYKGYIYCKNRNKLQSEKIRLHLKIKLKNKDISG